MTRLMNSGPVTVRFGDGKTLEAKSVQIDVVAVEDAPEWEHEPGTFARLEHGQVIVGTFGPVSPRLWRLLVGSEHPNVTRLIARMGAIRRRRQSRRNR